MTGLGKMIAGIFPKKAATKVIEEVAVAVKKEVPQVKKYLTPSQTMAFASKPLKRDGFYKIADGVYDVNNQVAHLKSINAPESLIAHAKKKYPVSLDTKAGVLKQYTPELKNRIADKHNEAQIKKLIKNAQKAEENKRKILHSFEHNYIEFEKTGITNPDEIMGLIKTGKYAQKPLFEALVKTGNATHAGQIMPEISTITADLTKAAEHTSERSDLKFALANRIKTVALIGDDNQQAELIKKLTTELGANHDIDVVKGIFKGIGDIGAHSPKDTKYSEILLDQLFTPRNKSVYEHLANFDGQFHIITKGLIDNPENQTILVAAYKSAKTPMQKQILLNEILKSEKMTNTAIYSATEFYKIAEEKAFKAEILSEIKAKKFDSLTTHYQNCLNSKLNIN